MKLPFGYDSVDALCRACEQEAAGYYPIGTGSFWHSGIHIYRSSKELFGPVIPGTVVMYRISEKYKTVNLPGKLTDSEYTDLFNGNAGKYIQKGLNWELIATLSDAEKSIPVSDNFIMLKHTVTVNQLNDKKMSFYTLYMNLAPLEEYAESCYGDKIIIGDSIQHPGKEGKEFPITTIGMPGLNNKERYIDFVVITEKKIFTYKKNMFPGSELSLFYGLQKSAKWYSQKIDKPDSKDYFVPKHTMYEIIGESSRNGQLIAKKIKITSVRVYLLSKTGLEKAQPYKKNEKYELKSVEIVYFSSGKDLSKSKSPDKNLEYLHSKLFNRLVSMIGQSVKVVDVTKAGQPAIDVDLSGDNAIQDFWVDEDAAGYFSGDKISDDRLISVYNENPIAGVFSEESITDEEKAEVADIKELEYRDKDGNIYYQVANKPDRYITSEDRNACFKPAFSWDVWFQEIKEGTGNCDDIFCDRTALVNESIKWYEDKRVKFALTIIPISIFWSGTVLTWVYLDHILGKKDKYDYAEDLCKQLRKIACIHPIEWDQAKFSGIKSKKENKKWSGTISSEMAKYLEDMSVATDIWKGGLCNIFTTNNLNFVHPLYFINHLDRAKVFGFNPYLNQEIPAFAIEEGNVPGNHRENKPAFIVKSNPGFAPLY